MSPICVLGKFHGLEPEVWVGARETDKVVRKSPAASAVFGFVVGCASISMAVHVSSVACMEPTKQQLHVGQEQEWRECVSLNGSSFNWDVSRAARGQPDSSVCLIVQFFHYIYGVCGKSQIKHNNEQLIMVCGINCRGKVYKESRCESQRLVMNSSLVFCG